MRVGKQRPNVPGLLCVAFVCIYTLYSIIWQVVALSHNPAPVSHLERIKGALQQHEALMTNIAETH